MQNFAIFFLWALAACVLQGSFAEDQSGPRLNEVAKAQNQGNTITRNADNEIKSKLERLEVKIGQVQAKLPQEVHAKLEGQLQGVENKLEEQIAVQTKLAGQLQGVVAKLGRQLQEMQTKLEAKLEDSLIAVQNKIENQLQTVVNQLQLVQNKTDAAEVKSQLQAKSNKTAVPQQAAKAGVPASSTITIPSGFNLFGINDREIEGHFVSVASHKPLPFLKWGMGQPTDKNHEENCVFLEDGRISDASSEAIAGFRESVDKRLSPSPCFNRALNHVLHFIQPSA
ncbi:collectin-11 [Drosophila kikkawai]|uniref:Collectin-11 n=1 Tax=Drosophila kikkawai TaxID=30033 RepID=A0A6P4IJI5_DROKI|nr:collectin-11 [Drosophila kikkawai]